MPHHHKIEPSQFKRDREVPAVEHFVVVHECDTLFHGKEEASLHDEDCCETQPCLQEDHLELGVG